MTMILGIMDPLRFLIDLTAFYMIYLILSVSMNLEYGYAGIPNLGKVMFFAAGSFITGSITLRLVIHASNTVINDFAKENIILTSQANQWLAMHPVESMLIMFVVIIISSLIGGILGLAASLPGIRLRESYLAITLLVSGELFRYIAKYYPPFIGGTVGSHVPDMFSWITNQRLHDITMLVLLALSGLFIWFIGIKYGDSPYGRFLRALRDNEEAFQAVGKNPVRTRAEVLFISSMMAAFAGSLYALYVGHVNANDFGPEKTFIVSLIIVIGGLGNMYGPLAGSFLYVFLDRIIRQLKYYIAVPFDVNYLALLLLGLVLLLFFFYKPEGVFSERPSKTIHFKGLIKKVTVNDCSYEKLL